MLRAIQYLLWISALMLSHFLGAQSIVRAEYFFDTDPGPGNGTPITISSPGNPTTFTETITTAGLTEGHHTLFVRTQSADFLWSHYEVREFIIVEPIVAAEYFFDTDPGPGNGTPLAITPGQTSFTSTIPTAPLTGGHHTLFIRTQHTTGAWSLYDQRPFYIQANIMDVEFFIDTDPGLGNGTIIPVSSPSDLVNVSFDVPVGLLANGTHNLFVRTRDEFDNWSFYEPQEFIVDDALPIELLNFNVHAGENRTVIATWATASELNNDHFELQRSANGFEFENAATVPGAGTALTAQYYTAEDNSPYSGLSYYRLKQVDRDGAFVYSPWVSVEIRQSDDFIVYPVPIVDDWSIQLEGEFHESSGVVELFNVTGEIIYTIAYQPGPLIRLKRENIAAGIYLVKLTTNKGRAVAKKIYFD